MDPLQTRRRQSSFMCGGGKGVAARKKTSHDCTAAGGGHMRSPPRKATRSPRRLQSLCVGTCTIKPTHNAGSIFPPTSGVIIGRRISSQANSGPIIRARWHHTDHQKPAAPNIIVSLGSVSIHTLYYQIFRQIGFKIGLRDLGIYHSVSCSSAAANLFNARTVRSGEPPHYKTP